MRGRQLRPNDALMMPEKCFLLDSIERRWQLWFVEVDCITSEYRSRMSDGAEGRQWLYDRDMLYVKMSVSRGSGTGYARLNFPLHEIVNWSRWWPDGTTDPETLEAMELINQVWRPNRLSYLPYGKELVEQCEAHVSSLLT